MPAMLHPQDPLSVSIEDTRMFSTNLACGAVTNIPGLSQHNLALD